MVLKALRGPRHAIKSLLAGGLYYSGALAVWQLVHKSFGVPSVRIFAFHRVVTDFPAAAARNIPALFVSTETFEAQLRYMAKHMEVLDLATALDVLRGRQRARHDICVLTFDDGYRDTYTHAFPILKQLGLPATVFVTTGFIGTRERLPHDRLYAALRAAAVHPPAPAPPHAERWAQLARLSGPAVAVERAARAMSHHALVGVIEALWASYGEGDAEDGDALLDWQMCADMAAHGVEIGTHTISHTVLTEETSAEIARELRDSRAEIERHIGRKVRYVAYPNGAYSERVIQVCRELEFEAALTTEDRPNRPGAHPLRLGRKLLWEAHGRGLSGRPSRALVATHIENFYGGALPSLDAKRAEAEARRRADAHAAEVDAERTKNDVEEGQCLHM